MSSYVIWIDSKECKIFELASGEPKVKRLQTHSAGHNLQQYGDKNAAHHHGLDPFFKDVAQSVREAKELILLGPAEAKVHFKAYLDKHFAHDLAKRVVAVETVDHPTDNQILAHARKFFRSFDAFQ